MNINQLRFVEAVVANGSFTAAAAACRVTQPTLSNGIALLEEELGQRLFSRTTRKVVLSAFGRHILPDIRRVLAARTALLQNANAFLSPSRKQITIGISPLLDAHRLNMLIEPFRSSASDVEIVFREMNMKDLERLLDEENIDFLFGIGSAGKAHRTTSFLYKEPLHYVASGSGEDDGTAPVAFDRIAGARFVMVPDACGLTRTIRELFRRHRKPLNEYKGQAMSYQVLEQWAHLGVGAAILPRSKLSSGARSGSPILDRSGRPIELSFHATWNSDSVRVPHVRQFADYLCRVVPAVSRGAIDGASPRKLS